MVDSSSAVGIYDTHVAAEAAITALREARFDMKQLSIIGKDFKPRSTRSASTTSATA